MLPKSRITTLPKEIFDQIVEELSPLSQRSLANLSETCQQLHYPLRFAGRTTWEKQTATIKALVPDGSYEIPQWAIQDDEVEDDFMTAINSTLHRSRGQPTSAPKRSNPNPNNTSLKKVPRRPGVCYIREIAIHGWWNVHNEAEWHLYDPVSDETVREHAAFIDALDALVWSVAGLESFVWRISRHLPERISANVARFNTLRSIEIFGDTKLSIEQESFHSHNQIPLCNNPLPFIHNTFTTIKALNCGDFDQIIDYGRLMSSASWNTLRHFEFDLSQGFIGHLVEMEPMEPDIVVMLFRPPAAPQGRRQTPKMKLRTLKLRDVAFQQKGIDAVVKSLDESEMRDISIDFCSDGMDLLRRWEDNKLVALRRLHMFDDIGFPRFHKFIKQFGPEGTCRNFKTLEVSCMVSHRWSYGFGYPAADDFFDDNYDGEDSEDWDGTDVDSDYDEFYPPPNGILPVSLGWTGGAAIAKPTEKEKHVLPQPFRAIHDLQGKESEGWGLERLILSTRPVVSPHCLRYVPNPKIFFEGFWNLRILALPVIYDTVYFSQLVEGVSKLPNLKYLNLLNSRSDLRSGVQNRGVHNIVSFNPGAFPINPPPLAPIPPPQPAQQTPAPQTNSRRRKTDKSWSPPLPDPTYVDVLSIAFKNRLADKVPSDSGHGKLRYIGVQSNASAAIVPRSPCKVWRVIVEPSNTTKLENAPGVSERRMSLRSSKRAKVEVTKDWRIAEEGDWACRLEVVPDDVIKKLGDGVFVPEGTGVREHRFDQW
ncbi:hypothetical protein FPQ18DRAFT_339938 [Pyronema domesticum]|nr:hypothetical protein FPQ18DRAFT_339938 [Pyronema domesticum]